MPKAQRTARWLAHKSGQIGYTGEKTLTDGTRIFSTDISQEKGQAVVKGLAVNGTHFTITVPWPL